MFQWLVHRKQLSQWLLEVLLKALHPEALEGLGAQAAIGAVVAFIVGLLAIWAVRESVSRGKLWAFAVYLTPLGIALIVWQFLS